MVASHYIAPHHTTITPHHNKQLEIVHEVIMQLCAESAARSFASDAERDSVPGFRADNTKCPITNRQPGTWNRQEFSRTGSKATRWSGGLEHCTNFRRRATMQCLIDNGCYSVQDTQVNWKDVLTVKDWSDTLHPLHSRSDSNGRVDHSLEPPFSFFVMPA